MSDPFLKETGVKTEEDAMREALKSALQQRQNKVYATDDVGNEREEFRAVLARLLREASKRYAQPTEPVSDEQHLHAIRRISDTLSGRFGPILKDGRLRHLAEGLESLSQVSLAAREVRDTTALSG